MKLTTIIFLLGISSFTFGQPPIEWRQSAGSGYEEFAYSMDRTLDDGYVFAGWSINPVSHGGRDYQVTKVDNKGKVQWQRWYGGTFHDEAKCIRSTSDGGYIVAGYSSSNDSDVTGHHGNVPIGDCWIIKIDSSGNLLWQKSVGGSQEDAAVSICEASDGGYVFVGTTASSANGDISDSLKYQSMLFVKLSSKGALEWVRTLSPFGGQRAFCIEPTSDNGFIVTGESAGSNNDAVVLKLNNVGDTLWARKYGGGLYDYLFSVKQTADSGYICAGHSSSSDRDLSHNFGQPGSATYDAWFLRLDANGDRIWSRSYGGFDQDFISSIKLTPDGGFIAAGETSSAADDIKGYHGPEGSDGWIVKLNADGDLEWNRAYGGSSRDHAYDIVGSEDGGYVFLGSTFSFNGDNLGFAETYLWLVKLGVESGVEHYSAFSITAPIEIDQATNTLITNDVLTLSCKINTPGTFSFSITDLQGKVIKLIEHVVIPDDDYRLSVNLSELASGFYVYCCAMNNFRMAKKFALMR